LRKLLLLLCFGFGIVDEAAIKTESHVDHVEQFDGVDQGIGGGHGQGTRPGFSPGLNLT